MEQFQFKYTNHQRGLRGVGGFFTVLFVGAALYIISNLGEFFDHSPVATIFIILMLIGFIANFFRPKGSEQKKDITLAPGALIVGGTERYLLSDLKLDKYQEGGASYYHLYSKGKDFTLYTPIQDHFINHILREDLIATEEFTVINYRLVQRNDSVVHIEAEGGRLMSFNLDTGAFSIQDGEDLEPVSYKPKNFIQTPKYLQKN